MVTLSHKEARRVYDRIGSFQDSQRFYEDKAVDLLVEKSAFDKADSVFEFGCGTGRFALKLLENYLPDFATYRGCDISPEMIRLASKKLEPFSPRAEVTLSEGRPPENVPDSTVDRFVSNYVFDLLTDQETESAISSAHKMLKYRGRLCLTGLTTGTRFPENLVSDLFRVTQTIAPKLVGGCRPIDLLPFLQDSSWDVEFHTKVKQFGITSEVIVALKK